MSTEIVLDAEVIDHTVIAIDERANGQAVEEQLAILAIVAQRYRACLMLTDRGTQGIELGLIVICTLQEAAVPADHFVLSVPRHLLKHTIDINEGAVR